ncbi:YceO family protein [Phytobacter sp. AG2a]
MRRLLQFVVNNVREHLMVYIVLWSVIAVIDLIYVIWAE